MTTVALLADPPYADDTDPLVSEGPLSPSEFGTLQAAMIGDVTATVAGSGGELLRNYRPADQLPDGVDDPKSKVVEATADAAGDARTEVQVGSSPSARAGNTVTHLLEREGVRTAAVTWPRAAFVRRPQIDSAAMKLRTSDVVLGPSPDGRVYYAAFAAPIDFEHALAPPALETLVERARDADLSVDFLEMVPLVERPADLPTVVSTVRARLAAGRAVPERTTALIEEWGLRVPTEGPPRVVRD